MVAFTNVPVPIGYGPATGGFTITPSDVTPLTKFTRAIYVGTTGNLAVIMNDGTTFTITTVPVGFYPLSVSQIKSTGTTATNLVGFY